MTEKHELYYANYNNSTVSDKREKINQHAESKELRGKKKRSEQKGRSVNRLSNDLSTNNKHEAKKNKQTKQTNEGTKERTGEQTNK